MQVKYIRGSIPGRNRPGGDSSSAKRLEQVWVSRGLGDDHYKSQ